MPTGRAARAVIVLDNTSAALEDALAGANLHVGILPIDTTPTFGNKLAARMISRAGNRLPELRTGYLVVLQGHGENEFRWLL